MANHSVFVLYLDVGYVRGFGVAEQLAECFPLRFIALAVTVGFFYG